MSRVGKLPITVPSGVTITVDKDSVTVSGPKGELKQTTLPGVTIRQEGEQMLIERKDDERESRSKHGLFRTLINNMVIGVTDGFSKKLEVNGVGYRVSLAGSDLKLNLGLSHDVTFKIPQNIVAKVDQNTIVISGIDKQKVGQIAAEIRALKKPEPYKGKGIKYADERIIRKSGKSGKEK